MTNQDEKLNILCLSNQQWDYPLWTNKKHVMSRLAKLGHNVVFVDPPINTGRLLLRQTLSGKWPLERLITQKYKDGNVQVVSNLNFAPAYDLLSNLHIKFIKGAAKKTFDANLKTVLWIYHVEIRGLKNFINQLDHDLLVYDCVDNYSAFPLYDTPEKKAWINSQEEYLSKNADVIFATAPGLVEKLQKYNKNVYFTPNVGDYDKYKNIHKGKTNIPSDLDYISRPRVGFVGAVDEYKFDRELVKKISKDHPDYSFVIIGPIALKDREASSKELGFEGFRNVYFMGSRDYEMIQEYYAGFDAYIIPYQLNDYTVGGCFPVKFHEALAAGLPTIVTNLPSYQPFKDVCYISKNYEDFSKNIKRALKENNKAKVKKRLEVAKNNNWDGKVSSLLEIIFQKLGSENREVSTK